MIKKFLAITAILLVNSCFPSIDNLDCPMSPTYREQDFAQSAYDDFTTSLADVTEEETKKMFRCFYTYGDKIYYYSRFMNSGYVLVRNNKAITYYEKN